MRRDDGRKRRKGESQDGEPQRKLLIRTMSLEREPRAMASCLPSRDQEKPKPSPEEKLVICFGEPPASGCRQLLEAPPRVWPSSIARPSGAHWPNPAPATAGNV